MEDEKKLIILVDNNPVYLFIWKKVLAKKYTIVTAPSAAKMFKFLENNRPFMILLDIDMPKMNGFEVIQILKSKQETKNIPVIFLSSCPEAKFEWLYPALGAAGHIIKPFNPFALLNHVEDLIT